MSTPSQTDCSEKRQKLVISLKEESEPHLLTSEFTLHTIKIQRWIGFCVPLESMQALFHFIAHSLVSFTITWIDMIFDQISHRRNFRQKVRTLRHCNNTLPRGGMFWKIRPLRQSRGPRGANCRAREGGVFCCFPIHSDSRQCITILFSRAEVYWILHPK